MSIGASSRRIGGSRRLVERSGRRPLLWPMAMVDGRHRLGILCGGGPAPGINSVISAATIEAVNSGWDVVGILDGFEHLIKGEAQFVQPLSIPDVSRIHVQGGSILFTSRANPTTRDPDAEDPDWRMNNCL